MRAMRRRWKARIYILGVASVNEGMSIGLITFKPICEKVA